MSKLGGREPIMPAQEKAEMSTDQSIELSPDVDALLAPFRQQVEESGISDEELTELGDSLRQEVRQLKQEQKLGM